MLAIAVGVSLLLYEPRAQTTAEQHIIAARIPATQQPATAIPPSRTPEPTTPPTAIPPLAVATMVVGTNTEPRVLVLVVTATPPATVGTPMPTQHHNLPQRQSGQMDAGFSNNTTSPLPTPVSPLPTPMISPLATPPLSGAPDAATEQTVYALINDLMAAETAYHNQHGAYAQLLLSDDATCPSGQACITLNYPAGLLAGVDVYAAPSGEGYEVHVNVDGWLLVVAVGPETWRAEAWTYEG